MNQNAIHTGSCLPSLRASYGWRLLLLLFLPLVLAGCGKNEFNVEFKLNPKVSGNYRLVYYASDKRTGFMMDMVAPVDKGVNKTRCITRNPVLVYIFNVGDRRPAAAFYAERGDKVRIEGDEADPLTWKIGGNKINREWSEWRNANAALIRTGDVKGINAAVAKFVKANTDSKVSTLLLLTTYDRREDEAGFLKLWNSLDDDAKPASLVSLVGRTDRLTSAEVAPPAAVPLLRLHAMGDSLVDLNPRRYQATLLYFNRVDDGGTPGCADSLRHLLGEEKSSRGRVAVISFETDSVAWLTKARSDSLDKALNAWIPIGEASEKVADMGVTRTPFFIVADTKGKQIYRGDQLKDALKTYRRLVARQPAKTNKPAKATKQTDVRK